MQKSGPSFLLTKLIGLKFSTLTARKLLFVILLCCVSLYYILPLFYHQIVLTFSYENIGLKCMQRQLKKVTFDVENFDAIITDTVSGTENHQIPFVGNGKVGSIASYDKPSLYVFYDKNEKIDSLSETADMLRLPFSLMIKPQYDAGINQEESSVLNYRHGIVEQFSCFTLADHLGGLIFVNHTIVAHRSRPSVFLQHIEATMEGKRASLLSDFTLTQDIPSSAVNFKLLNVPSSKKYRLYGGPVKFQNKYMTVVVAVSEIPLNLHIRNGKAHHDSVSVILHGNLLPDQYKNDKEMNRLATAAKTYMDEVLSVSMDALLQEHKNAWNDILHTGLRISHSTTDEPGIPHPLDINSTLYSILSSMDSKLHDKDLPQKERYDLMKRLQTPDFCYNDNPTLHAKKLWQRPSSVESVLQLAKLWSLSLKKSGCKNLVSEGAEGMLQAVVLSFGRLQYTKYHLQLHADPDILHNDIAFQGIMFKNNTIDIELRYENGASSILISLKKSLPRYQLYACEAGCASGGIQITAQPKVIPVLITYPPSPILYISASKTHLQDLKHTIIVNEIVEHAQHLESKKEPGLPWIFWLGIGSLIVFFHLYLIRLICKEYYNSATLPSTINRNYYSNRGRLAS